MSLILYNTLTRQKEPFAPIDPHNVRMYVCGPTVYDRAHIGNARPIIVFDLLFRLLRHTYGEAHVKYVRNITDVDDKINARAAERGISIRELTEGTTAQFHANVAALGCLPPTVEPRATEHISQMIAIIEQLIKRGHAYVAEGHVLFSTASMPEYGKLSNRSLDEMIAGARVEIAPYKKDPADFVLWKNSNSENEPSWPSPWGAGRPGWHIECSAMSAQHLGEVFDIHGGGIDLVFPHHENEIAQSCCAHGTERMANVWMHNGFLQVEGQKMSKSLGNFITIGDVLKDWPGDEVRLNMLKTHYRQPIDWTVKGLEESAKALEGWRKEIANHASNNELSPDFLAALSDDLNTPQAIAELHKLKNKGDAQSLGALAASLQWLGFGLQSSKIASSKIDEAAIEALIAARNAARAAKNWAESDRLRDKLQAMGIILKDNKDGTTSWEVG